MCNTIEERVIARKAEIVEIKKDICPDPGFLIADSITAQQICSSLSVGHKEIWARRSSRESAQVALEKFQSSSVRRAMYLATGRRHGYRTKVKALEEKRQFAQQAEQCSVTYLSNVQRQHREAQDDRLQHEVLVSKHEESLQRLDPVYASIFEGACDRSKEDQDRGEKLRVHQENLSAAEDELKRQIELVQHLSCASDLLNKATMRFQKLVDASEPKDQTQETAAMEPIEERDMLDIVHSANKVDQELLEASGLKPELEIRPIRLEVGATKRGTLFHRMQRDRPYWEQMRDTCRCMCDVRSEVTAQQISELSNKLTIQAHVSLEKAMLERTRNGLRRLREDKVQSIIGETDDRDGPTGAAGQFRLDP